MSVLDKLTEGIVSRDLRQEGDALLSKWEKTGLLEGLDNDANRQGMARLLENQAAQLLKEASTMAGGNVEGFASVAFPLVRRVFGGLLANDVVSVQPMSLPSGLIFFLDFTFSNNAGINARGQGAPDTSVYGGGKVGFQITGGVDLGYEGSKAVSDSIKNNQSIDVGFYNLSTGYASPTGSTQLSANELLAHHIGGAAGDATIDLNPSNIVAGDAKALRYDPDVLGLGDGHEAILGRVAVSNIEDGGEILNRKLLSAVYCSINASATGSGASMPDIFQVRRLTALGSSTHHPTEAAWDGTETHLYFAFVGVDAEVVAIPHNNDLFSHVATIHFPLSDNFGGARTNDNNDSVGVVIAQTDWGLENEADIPEIDIKVDSVAVTAVTKKLKAKWTPELGQDLNAYHNLDAEVELTSVLS